MVTHIWVPVLHTHTPAAGVVLSVQDLHELPRSPGSAEPLAGEVLKM